jgi:hypothetical protein
VDALSGQAGQTIVLAWGQIIVQWGDDVLHGVPGHIEASSTEVGEQEPSHAEIEGEEIHQIHPAQLHDESMDGLPSDPEIASQLTRVDAGVPIECLEGQVEGRREANLLQRSVDRVREPLLEAADGSEQGRGVEGRIAARLRVHAS